LIATNNTDWDYINLYEIILLWRSILWCHAYGLTTT